MAFFISVQRAFSGLGLFGWLQDAWLRDSAHVPRERQEPSNFPGRFWLEGLGFRVFFLSTFFRLANPS